MKENNNAAWENHEKRLNDKIFLILLIIVLLAFAYRVFVYDPFFNPVTLFVKADKTMSMAEMIKVDEAEFRFIIDSTTVNKERADEDYTDTKDAFLLDDEGKELAKAKLSKYKDKQVIRLFKNEFTVRLLDYSADVK